MGLGQPALDDLLPAGTFSVLACVSRRFISEPLHFPITSIFTTKADYPNRSAPSRPSSSCSRFPSHMIGIAKACPHLLEAVPGFPCALGQHF